MRSCHTTIRRNILSLSGLMIALLSFLSSTFAGTAAEPNDRPAALIKNIVINNQERTDASSSQAIVTRTNGDTVSVTTGLMLYRGDLIDTFANTKLTVLYLDDPVSEKANEVIIDANSRIGISSTDSWWGRIQVKIKGTFTSRSRYVRLGARGTEYDFTVFKGEDRSELIMLEGIIDATEGNFTLVGAAQSSEAMPALRTADTVYSINLFKTFAHKSAAQEQYGRTVDVDAGNTANFTFTFHISNNCRRLHNFEFRTSSDTPWLQLEIEKVVSVPPSSSRPFEGVVKVIATNLQPSQYRGRIYAACTDCTSESRCNSVQLEWPISLTVNRGTTTPAISSFQELSVRELERVSFTKGADQSIKAPAGEVVAALNWTNDVILPAQPTYLARNLVPHFSSLEERNQNFRTARLDSILSKDKIGSNKILGDIYNDWGEGTRAFTAYRKELKNDSSRRNSAASMADLSEAYRVTGNLDDAKQTLNSIPAANQQSALVRNAAGNLALTESEIARDEGNPDRASILLTTALENFKVALLAQPTSEDRAGRSERNVTIQSNLGEVYLASGNIALQQGQAAEARRQFDAAAQVFIPIQRASTDYPHPITDLGKAYQGLGRLATIEGNVAEARTAYAQAESQHKQAIIAHSDFAEAYSNLGDVYVDLGNKEAAKDCYRKAIKARPEQPAPYYPLALLVQDEDPELAKALAGVYLHLQPAAFKTGERARDAERITTGVAPDPNRGSGRDNNNAQPTVVPNVIGMTIANATRSIENAGLRTRIIEQRDNRQPPDTVLKQDPIFGQKVSRDSTVSLTVAVTTDPPPPPPGTIKVPEVVDDKRDTAIRKIEKKGLKVGQVIERASCDKVGKVLEQTPRKDTKVGEGAVVDLVIGSIGADGVNMPSLNGRSRDDAESMIRDSGLRLVKVRTEEADRPEGTVLNQKPKSGTPMARDCPVEITVAIPIPWVYLDNYVNLTEQDARARLSNVGLNANTRNQQSEGTPGIVVAQDPPVGGRVRKGGSVTLYVSVKPPPNDQNQPKVQNVKVPNLKGMTLEAAKAAIWAAGLTVGNTSEDSDNNFPDHTVKSQDPPAGVERPVGTTVNFVIAVAQIIEE